LQTEFADIPAVEVGALAETKRGHLALDYTCMKWVQLSSKVRDTHPISGLLLQYGVTACACASCVCLFA
jgi:U3 small nucleolar RNA-associated protein 5